MKYPNSPIVEAVFDIQVQGLEDLTQEDIEKLHFKRLLYLIAHKIKNSSLQYDEDIEKNFINLISFETYQTFEDIVNLAKNDGILTPASFAMA